MKPRLTSLLGLAVPILFWTVTPTHCSIAPGYSVEKNVQIAHCIFRGTVISVEPFLSKADGAIYTRTIVRVDEVLKGKMPNAVELVHFGGALAGFGVANCATPTFTVGDEHLLFVRQRPDGTLGVVGGVTGTIKLEHLRRRLLPGQAENELVLAQAALLEHVRALISASGSEGADLTAYGVELSEAYPQSGGSIEADANQTVTNFLTAPDGFPPRWVTQDKGDPIPYLVDMSILPSGITTNQALAAVSNALVAWAAVTSLKFVFDGITNFGMPAELVATNDGKLRIQLYSYTNYIAIKYGPSYLGMGGPAYYWGLLDGAGWGLGGNVAGNEFHKICRGFVMINHSNELVNVPSTLTEVLCHELGHALGLAHSGDPQAIMYPTAHADGRGAQLAASDIAVIRQGYPQLNTPPFVYPRVMDITTAPWPFTVPGINEIELACYDLQTPNLTVAVTNATAGTGQFTLASQTLLRFTPNAFYSAPRVDPGGSSYYERIAYRCYDGTNAAPYEWVRVISFNPDQYPLGAPDGIPDAWMTSWFGDPDPAAGLNRGAYDDYDGDGLTNLQEYRAGMNPTNPSSCQRIIGINSDSISWQAKPYELYELEYTTNLSNAQWQPARIQILPNTATATVYRISTVPGQAKFFRVKKVP